MGKKLITFLGAGSYKKTKYRLFEDKGEDENNIVETYYFQEALLEKLGKDIEVFVCLTKDAKKNNWDKRILLKEEKFKKFSKHGLEYYFNRNNINYKIVDIEDGSSEDEIWKNFNTITDIIDDEDEIYLDITYSFRSIPIMMMSILNYAKFTKNIKVGGIYYGAFEAKENGVAPIFNLTSFDTITDWTMGANNFIKSGNSRDLSKIIVDTVEDDLKYKNNNEKKFYINVKQLNEKIDKFSEDLHTNRGMNISYSSDELKNKLEEIKKLGSFKDNKLKPLEKILEEIYNMVSDIGDNEVLNIHEIAKLSFELNMFQRSYTFLRENIINFLYEKSNIEEILGINKIKDIKKMSKVREDLLDILRIKYGNENIILKTDEIELNKEQIFINLENYINKDIYNLSTNIGDARNDINHAGYKETAMPSDKISKKLEKHLNDFEILIIKEYYSEVIDEQ